MLSYEFYKIFHLLSLFVFFVTISIQLWNKKKEKILSILLGISTLFILVSGMGLLARLGINHLAPWPKWAILKLIIWLTLGFGGAVVVKRFIHKSRHFLPVLFVIFYLAVLIIIYKPE